MAREKLDVAQLKNDGVSFLWVDKKVYTVTPVSCNLDQVFDEIKQHLGERVDRFMADVNEDLYTRASEEGRKEIEHIRRQMERGDIAVPPAMFNKPIVALGNRISEVKSVVHCPCIARGSYIAWCDRIGVERTNEIFARVTNFAAVREGNREMQTARLECRFTHPNVEKQKAIVHIAKIDNHIYTNGISYHSTSTAFNGMWRSQCTGNMTATQYFALPNLAEVFNSINFDSIGSSTARFGAISLNLAEFFSTAVINTASRTLIMPDAWRVRQ